MRPVAVTVRVKSLEMGSRSQNSEIELVVEFLDLFISTPAKTHSISGLKSRVLKLTFLASKMIVKSGLEFILKFTEPLQRYLLHCQANSALLGRFFGTGQQQL